VLSTNPGSGDLVYESPPTVDIVINSDVSERSATVALTDPSGQVVRLGPVLVDKARISASVPRLTSPGAYQVTYRVTTLDGHPVSASYTFTLSTSRAPTLVDWVVGILQGAIPAAAVIAAGVVFWRWRSRRRASTATSHTL
jgi:methionine-rich copper-binding protein CopC